MRNKPKNMASCTPFTQINLQMIDDYINQRKVLRFQLKKGDEVAGKIISRLNTKYLNHVGVLFEAFNTRRHRGNRKIVLKIPTNSKEKFYIDLPYWFSK